MKSDKEYFIQSLQEYAECLTEYVSTHSGDWSIKGFIDIDTSVYTLSADTKMISKILEIQIFPKIQLFADKMGYELILAEKQNWYPDMSFVKKSDTSVKFAVDLKTTYRLDEYQDFCNGFTLGSHGEYFINRKSYKNIQFPYGAYQSHLSLCAIYTRTGSEDIEKTEIVALKELECVESVIGNLDFFVQEKWRLSSDRSGSGNTANIGSIDYVPRLLTGSGTFTYLGEEIFDAYWMNYGRIQVPNTRKKGEFKKLTRLEEFLEFKGMETKLLNPAKRKRKNSAT